MLVLLLVAAAVPTAFAAEEYFPSGAFEADKELDREFADYFGGVYSKMKLESLYKHSGGNRDRECYRFVKSFDVGPTVAITISRGPEDRCGMEVVRLVREAESGQGKAVERWRSDLSVDQWMEFRKRIMNMNFWDLPSRNPGISYEDPSHLLLEGLAGKKYHVTERRDPMPPDYRAAYKAFYEFYQSKINRKNEK